MELSVMQGVDISGVEIMLLVTGVGVVETSWSLMNHLAEKSVPDIAINIGIAGSFRLQLPVSTVVVPGSDCFGDIGIEDKGNFKTLFESGLSDPDRFPYRKGYLVPDPELLLRTEGEWPVVNAVTVSTSSGSSGSIRRLSGKFDPDIETMEGAAFYYVCARQHIPAIALRSISNMVEPRNRPKWDIPSAMKELQVAVNLLINKIV